MQKNILKIKLCSKLIIICSFLIICLFNIIFMFKSNATGLISPYEFSPTKRIKLCIIGDSISDHNHYPEGSVLYMDYLQDRENYDITNLAIRGTGFVSYSTNPLFASFRYGLRVLSMPKDTEVLLVLSSLNDIAELDKYSYPIGSLDDTTEETLCGSMNLFLQRARAINPNVKIGITTPLKWIDYEKDELKKLQCEQYVNAVKTWALYNNIPLLDLYNDKDTFGFNLFDYTLYLKEDGTHIKPEVHAGYMYPRISAFLQQILTTDFHDNGIDESEVKMLQNYEFEDMSTNKSGTCKLYYNKYGKYKDKIIAVNAGHGIKDTLFSDTYAHPNKTPLIEKSGKTGSVYVKAKEKAITFDSGDDENVVNLKLASKLMYELLHSGFSVLMIRENNEQRLDNIARTVLANNNATIHVSIYYDNEENENGIGYIKAPEDENYVNMHPVKESYQKSEELAGAIINCLRYNGETIYGTDGKIFRDIQQNAFSSIPTVSLQMGNSHADCSEDKLTKQAKNIAQGIKEYFEYYVR